jgi:hypothetical protein
MLLTIGIPSFNRPEAALESVKKNLKARESSDFSILLVNNGSELDYKIDETWQNQQTKFQYIKFLDNLGFGQNIIRLIEHCETKYLLFMSDEDFLSNDGVNKLEIFLKEKNPTVTILRSKPKTFKKTKKIKMNNIRGISSNMSGIIINLNILKMYLPNIKKLVETEEFAFLYPHMLIVALLNSLRSGYILSLPTIISQDALPTTVVATSGHPYFYPTERVIQHISFFKCVEKIDQMLDGKARRRLNQFTKANEKYFFGIIHDAVKIMDSKLANMLLKSSFRTYLNSKAKTLLKNKF